MAAAIAGGAMAQPTLQPAKRTRVCFWCRQRCHVSLTCQIVMWQNGGLARDGRYQVLRHRILKIEADGDTCPALTLELVGHWITKHFACISSLNNLLGFRTYVCSLTATKAAP